MQSPHEKYRTKGFLVRLIVAQVSGQTAEDFAAQELRIMHCKWCANNIPFGEDGQHHLLGLDIPCDAAQ